jgi:hypothetical protein
MVLETPSTLKESAPSISMSKRISSKVPYNPIQAIAIHSIPFPIWYSKLFLPNTPPWVVQSLLSTPNRESHRKQRIHKIAAAYESSCELHPTDQHSPTTALDSHSPPPHLRRRRHIRIQIHPIRAPTHLLRIPRTRHACHTHYYQPTSTHQPTHSHNSTPARTPHRNTYTQSRWSRTVQRS